MNTEIINKIFNEDLLFVDVNNNIFTNNCKIIAYNYWNKCVGKGIAKVYKNDINLKLIINNIPIEIKYSDSKQSEILNDYFKQVYINKFNRDCILVYGINVKN